MLGNYTTITILIPFQFVNSSFQFLIPSSLTLLPYTTKKSLSSFSFRLLQLCFNFLLQKVLNYLKRIVTLTFFSFLRTSLLYMFPQSSNTLINTPTYAINSIFSPIHKLYLCWSASTRPRNGLCHYTLNYLSINLVFLVTAFVYLISHFLCHVPYLCSSTVLTLFTYP